MSHTIYLAQVGDDHSITFPKVWDDIKPYWLGDAGCDLTKNDPIGAVHAEQSAAESAETDPCSRRGDGATWPSPAVLAERWQSTDGHVSARSSSFLYQSGDAFAFLVLAACGLAVIFGMMGVINLAHGEFIMCGAYVDRRRRRAPACRCRSPSPAARLPPGSSAW